MHGAIRPHCVVRKLAEATFESSVSYSGFVSSVSLLRNHVKYGERFIDLRQMRVSEAKILLMVLSPLYELVLHKRPFGGNHFGESRAPARGLVIDDVRDYSLTVPARLQGISP
jgi:hypothetical protein